LAQTLRFWLGWLGEVPLVCGRWFAAGAAVAFELGDPFFQGLNTIPKHKNQVRDSLGISLCQGDEFVTGRSLHHDSTQIR
jgi:hypothetical protein